MVCNAVQTINRENIRYVYVEEKVRHTSQRSAAHTFQLNDKFFLIDIKFS